LRYNRVMATKVYDIEIVQLVDGTTIELTPLKIKYLREFMVAFDKVKDAEDDDIALQQLIACGVIAMKQYYPSIKTEEDLEDLIDIKTLYRLLDIAAGIKMSSPEEDDKESVKKKAEESESSWEKFDLAALESELFLLGIWKDYNELELSLSMPEMMATLESKRDQDYQEKKFLAAIQGVDLEANNEKSNAWEEMKARVFSGGQAANANDIVALQGANAQKAGFGIGLGLDYVDLREN
jgi:hypothetical protein